MGFYHDGSRRLQDRFDSRRLADRLEDVKVRDFIDDGDRAFIESMDMLFLATADEHGRPNCSYKGGEPGFVRVLDERTLAFPSYDGNGMFVSTGNMLVNPEVGLLFISFEHRRRLRLNGTATHRPDRRAPPVLAGSSARRPRPGARGLPELPALHPPLRARRTLPLPPARGNRATRPGLEAHHLGQRRPPALARA